MSKDHISPIFPLLRIGGMKMCVMCISTGAISQLLDARYIGNGNGKMHGKVLTRKQEIEDYHTSSTNKI